jgi:hypothetical protein
VAALPPAVVAASTSNSVVVMVPLAPVWFVVGATTVRCTPRSADSARTSASRPGASTPSSLVTST